MCVSEFRRGRRRPAERFRLRDLAQHFAANVFASGFPIAHHALGRADDLDAHAAKHGLEFFAVSVGPAAGAADSLDRLNHTLAIGTVLQFKSQGGAGAGFFGFFLPVPNESFPLENIRNAAFEAT